MIYVHVPFCRSFCTYCGFYSEAAPKCGSVKQDALFEEYLSALETEIRTRKHDIERVFASGGVNTLYIGGGTPSVLPLYMFERLISVLREVGHLCDFQEFTIEVNPEDIVEKGCDYVKGLVALGVNRVSMGLQSFDDDILKWMNRRHSARKAVEAYNILEQAGVDNISIDLIFGLPQMNETLWRETLSKALNISSTGRPPKHISAYQLSIEEDSMLEKLIARGKWSEATDEVCERQYDVLCEVLREAGYNHYEISNFAQPGFEAVHNSAYWRHCPYVGLGPGAHSYIFEEQMPCGSSDARCAEMAFSHPRVGGGAQLCWEGAIGVHWRDAYAESIRQWNESDLKGYIAASQDGDFAKVQGGEKLDDQQLIMERVMLGLRTAAGVSEDFLRKACDTALIDDALTSGNLIRIQDGNIRIPENRFFISDNIISSII